MLAPDVFFVRALIDMLALPHTGLGLTSEISCKGCLEWTQCLMGLCLVAAGR